MDAANVGNEVKDIIDVPCDNCLVQTPLNYELNVDLRQIIKRDTRQFMKTENGGVFKLS